MQTKAFLFFSTNLRVKYAYRIYAIFARLLVATENELGKSKNAEYVYARISICDPYYTYKQVRC